MRAVLRAAAGVAIGLLARLWVATLRVTVLPPPGDGELPGEVPWVLAFFHGQQFALLRWPRRRPTGVMVSLSADGDIQARALPRLGLVIRRGSTSRGGARALAALVRLLRSGHDAAFAVDGPRGPWGAIHPGAAAAAHHARGVLVPLACASSPRLVLLRAWDRFELPWPFARVTIAVGAPLLCPDAPEAVTEALRHALHEALDRARAHHDPDAPRLATHDP